jgi:hypothetical protein
MLRIQNSRNLVLSLIVLLFVILPTTVIASNWVGDNFIIADISTDDSFNPSVAYNTIHDEYLVVWTLFTPGGVNEIRAQRISGRGQLLGGVITVSADVNEDKLFPDVVFNPDDGHFLVVWENWDASGFYTINGRRLSSAGTVLDGSDIEISGSPSPHYFSETPAVAYSPTSDRYIVVWDELSSIDSYERILGQSIQRDGTPDGSNFLISEADTETRRLPDIAYDPGANQFLVVWEEDHIPVEVLGRMVDGPGGASGSVLTIISEDKNCQNPRIAAMPGSPVLTRFMVAFTYEHQVGDRDLYLALLNSSGSAQNVLLYDTSDHDVSFHAVAASPYAMEYIVTWVTLNPVENLYAGFVDKDGFTSWEKLWIDSERVFTLAAAHGSLGDFLVVWDDSGNSEFHREIHGQLFGNRQYLPLTMK